MKKEKKTKALITPHGQARIYAKEILGEDQFKNNKEAAGSIAKDWIAGFKAGQLYQLARQKAKIDSSFACHPSNSGIALIAKERVRSVQEEGYDSAHDDEHKEGELADAAAVYALSEDAMSVIQNKWGNDMYLYLWPFKLEELKKDETGTISKRIKDLVKAGNLIASEIDRLQRLEGRDEK